MNQTFVQNVYDMISLTVKAIVKDWGIWINFHHSFEKCSILTPDIRKPQTSLESL